MTQYVFAPQAPISVPVVGSDEQFPVRRVYCVGRNYAAHAREMGFDPDREPPFFFCKPADAVVPVAAGETLDYRIRRKPTTITTKLSWWWRLASGARYPAGAGA
jgi:2-keto-4-pentenoate hydratase/2-oxohepta-3-ene-1,7-dioic acid hydratase in catechol pathway